MATPLPPRRGGPRRRSYRALALTAILASVCSLLAACGSSDSGTTTLIWYINPDAGGQAKVAENCSKGKPYTIETQVLPQNANEQRIQLARRLAAEDSGIDLMSLDPPFTAEFSDAGFLADIPSDVQDQLKQQSFQGAVDAATWNDQLVVFPFWSNTQVLWYRKSFVDKAGLDMSQPVTWDQIIDAADQNGGTVAVQANKYEGYVVWINALISGAGGDIVSDTEKGADASIDVDSQAGDDAAAVIQKLSHSTAAPPDLSVSNEGTAAATFASDSGAFMVNWTFIYHNYDETDPDLVKDMGYTMYPETVQGQDARPPYGGIGIGVSKYSTKQSEALEAAQCLVSPDNQGENAVLTGNMPASSAGYEYPELKKLYPADLRQLFQQSVDAAAPRSVTPYWSDISSALQSTWHPSASVNQDTPSNSADFIGQVLDGKALL